MKYLVARTTAISVCLLICSLVTVWHYSENSSSAAAGCGTPSFAVVVTPNVNNSLNALAMGDLNGDTKPDLVTANEFSNQVTILVGNGAGNFSVSSTMATGTRPSALVLGDFNGDTKLDLAVSFDFSTTVSLYLGTGSATFTGPTNFTVGTNPLRLVSADFNNDGKLDLASGNDGSNTISILLGNGSGGFAPATSIANVRPASLVVADFNHDNKPDIAAANFANNKVTVMLGDGAGGFGPLTHFDGGTSLQGIASADFNNDTHPDIVVTNNECCNPAFVAVLLGNGSGSFTAPTKFSTPLSPFAVVTGDFNGDGNADVATVNVQQNSSNVSVLTGNGAGALSGPTNFNVGTTPIRIVTGDVNLDNAPDLVVTSPPNVAALLNACGGAPTPTPTATPTPSPTPTPVPTPAQGDVVISQVYSGGGNPGSTYQNNFIELFNRTDSTIDISGWPIYFTSDTGAFNSFIAFVSSRGIGIAPHGYLLIQFGPSSTNGAPLSPDFIDDIAHHNLSPSGKVLLSRPNFNLVGSTCPVPSADIVDFVGYGTAANCFEGNGPTGNVGNTTAAIRKYNGCVDSNNNAGDFLVSAPNPHNSHSPANNCVNPIDGADFFVRQHYSDFLNRQPDAPGLAFWTNEITSCGLDAQCVDIKRSNVSAAFFLSIEFHETGYLVERLYKAAYGDVVGFSTNGGTLHQLLVPVVRFNEFLPDSQQIGQGVIVGQNGWEQILENNKVTFLSQFVTRTRFASAYPTTLTPAQFVDGLFAHTGVMPAPADRTSIINEFGGAGSSADNAARARALRRVAEYPAFDQLEKNNAFVLMQYFGYLRRNPNDPPDSDYTGYDFWLTKLGDFHGDYIRAEMVRAFLISSEYRLRFGP